MSKTSDSNIHWQPTTSAPTPPQLPKVPSFSFPPTQKLALENWIKDVADMKRDYQRTVEFKTIHFNTEHTNEKNRIETNLARRKDEIDTTNDLILDEIKRLKLVIEDNKNKLQNEFTQGRKDIEEQRKTINDKIKSMHHSTNTWNSKVDEGLRKVKEELERLEQQQQNEQITARQSIIESPAATNPGDRPPQPTTSEPTVSSANRQHSDAPNHLIDPITLELMNDPVIASDGHTYDRISIQHVFDKTPTCNNPRSPMTGEILSNRNLLPNHAIRGLLRDYQEKIKS